MGPLPHLLALETYNPSLKLAVVLYQSKLSLLFLQLFCPLAPLLQGPFQGIQLPSSCLYPFTGWYIKSPCLFFTAIYMRSMTVHMHLMPMAGFLVLNNHVLFDMLNSIAIHIYFSDPSIPEILCAIDSPKDSKCWAFERASCLHSIMTNNMSVIFDFFLHSMEPHHPSGADRAQWPSLPISFPL